MGNTQQASAVRTSYEALAAFVHDEGPVAGIVIKYFLSFTTSSDLFELPFEEAHLREELHKHLRKANAESAVVQSLQVDLSYFHETFSHTLAFLSDEGYISVEEETIKVLDKLIRCDSQWFTFSSL